jgi:ATP-binding cassette, subfamily B, bacterial
MAFETSNECTAVMFDRYSAFKRLGMPSSSQREVFVRQRAPDDSGIACLAMVLAHFGKELSLQQVSETCRGAENGINPEVLLNSANLLGLRGRIVKVRSSAELKLLPLGSTILKFDADNFVILSKVSSGCVEIVDPAQGKYSLSKERFEARFAGVAMTFEASEVFEDRGSEGALYATVRQLVVSTGALPKIIAISTLIQGLGLALPLLTGKLLDRVLPRGDAQLLTVLLVGAVLLITFDALGKLVRGYVLLHMRTLVDSRLTLGFVEHLVSLPYAYFQRKSAGDLMMRLNANAVVRRELTTGVLCTLLDGMYLIVAVGFLLFSNVPFALSTAAVALVLIVQFVVQRKRHLGLSNAVLDAVTKARNQEGDQGPQPRSGNAHFDGNAQGLGHGRTHGRALVEFIRELVERHVGTRTTRDSLSGNSWPRANCRAAFDSRSGRDASDGQTAFVGRHDRFERHRDWPRALDVRVAESRLFISSRAYASVSRDGSTARRTRTRSYDGAARAAASGRG